MALSGNPLLRDLRGGINYAFQPMITALHGIGDGVSSAFGALAEIERLRVDNTQLRVENEQLTAENARLEEIRRENELLTGLLQLRNGFEFETVAAQVVSWESSEFRRLVTLDRGTDNGLQNGDVVVAQGGALAGRIVEIGPNYARVLLITDTGSTVIGMLPTAGTGEVVGQVNGVLVMTRIDVDEAVEPGQEIVTAGIQLAGGARSPFPKGLLIGQVLDVRRDANAVVQTAFLLPAAPLDRLEYVLVITDYEGGLPPLEGQPVPCTPEGEEGVLPENERPCATPGAPTPAP
jgi:rod shape-determining protein MreC